MATSTTSKMLSLWLGKPGDGGGELRDLLLPAGQGHRERDADTEGRHRPARRDQHYGGRRPTALRSLDVPWSPFLSVGAREDAPILSAASTSPRGGDPVTVGERLTNGIASYSYPPSGSRVSRLGEPRGDR